jgi:DNA topoisomerase-3
VQKKEKAKPRPPALNTVEMLRVASSGLGIGPQHAMQIAERLYTQGYISYPRTETNSYPENFDLKAVLRQQTSSPDWGHEASEILRVGIQRPKKGHDAGDHPPITPMKAATEAELGHEAWRLYDYITRHFIATLSSDCKYLQTTITFEVAGELFSFVGKTVIDAGFTALMPWQAIPVEESLPLCELDQTCAIKEVKLVEKQTCPPDYLSEAELISLMEKHGIGTDASIPVHINNICERNYVTVTAGRRLKPTTLGIVLVHGYQKIDVDLVKPTMRAAIEEQLNLIAHGKADFDAVLQHTLTTFTAKFKYFVEHILAMDELFEVSFSPLASSGRPLSRCGKCRRYMKLIIAKPCRLHCASCDETLTVPQNCNIRLYKELKCPLDEYELLYCTTGTSGKGYALCPYCYNHPPFKEMKKGMGCNECTHPSCPHGLAMTGVSSCIECDTGMLVLDMMSAPKWRIVCNRCNVVVKLLDNATKVTLTGDSCDECQSSILEVHFKNKSPLPDNSTEHTGCIFCDPILRPLVEMKYAKHARPVNIRRGGGPGRPGRGRGRGGRGPPKPKDKMSQLAAYFV